MFFYGIIQLNSTSLLSSLIDNLLWPEDDKYNQSILIILFSITAKFLYPNSLSFFLGSTPIKWYSIPSSAILDIEPGFFLDK